MRPFLGGNENQQQTFPGKKRIKEFSLWIYRHGPRSLKATMWQCPWGRDSSVVERRTRFPAGLAGDFYSPGSTFLFQYSFHLRVTAESHTKCRSFCQKCRWQVTSKHSSTLCMWHPVRWHYKLVHGWMYGAHRTRRDGSSFTWHQPCNNKNNAISTPLGYSHLFRVTHD